MRSDTQPHPTSLPAHGRPIPMPPNLKSASTAPTCPANAAANRC